MKKNITVSVVMPAFNAEWSIGQAIRSIQTSFEADGVTYEIIVIDNGSTDRTVEIAQRLNAKLYSQPAFSVSALRNFGASQTQGHYIAFIDSDCLISEGWFERGRTILEKEKNGIVGCDYSYQPETSSWVERLWFKSNYPVFESATWLPAGNMLIRKGLFFKISGFREDIETAEDWDLCARMIGLGYHVISDGRMKCIHVGNPKTLRKFFQKELWYGKGAAQLYYEHGVRGPIQKLTLTCLIAIYVLLLDVLFIILGQGVAWSWLPLTVSIVFLHPVVMGVHRSLTHGRIYLFPGLTLLYAVYCFARCAAWQHYLFQHPLRYLTIWRPR